jgi:hypothetical protein
MGLLHDKPLELHLRGKWRGDYEFILRLLAGEAGLPQEQIVTHPPAPPADMVRLASAFHVGLALEPFTVNIDLAISRLFTYVVAGNAVIATRTTTHLSIAPRLGHTIRTYHSGQVEELAAILNDWLENPNRLGLARRSAWRMDDPKSSTPQLLKSSNFPCA